MVIYFKVIDSEHVNFMYAHWILKYNYALCHERYMDQVKYFKQ